jgi:hypothetical protein
MSLPNFSVWMESGLFGKLSLTKSLSRGILKGKKKN